MAIDKAEVANLWWGCVALLGLILLAYSYAIFPVSRESLVVVELEAPLPVRRVLFESSSNRNNYFTQHVEASMPGRGKVAIRPVARMLIDEIETVSRGAVRFLVDPIPLTIYEVSVDGRIVLSYAQSASRQRRHALIALFGGLFCIGVGALGLAPLRWARDKSPAPPNS